MDLLDSFIAFALTLAALATVATLVLEIAFRVLRLKRIGQLRLVDKLIDHAEALADGTVTPPAAGKAARVDLLLSNPFAVNIVGFVTNLADYWSKASAVYEDISLEHTLRRLVDVVGKQDPRVTDRVKQIGDRLTELGLKYDEYCGALAVRYKQNAQRWSLVVGVLLAFAMNVDGFRILQLYLQDPTLREEVIKKLTPEEQGEAAQAPAAAEPAAETPPTAGEAGTQAQLKEMEEKYAELRGQLAVVSGLALPIGWDAFPYCGAPVEGSERDIYCPQPAKPGEKPAAQKGSRAGAILGWFVHVLVTGLLIGLGAPFWYDVARRLAAVRSAFGGEGTAEQRHRGDDAQEGSWARKRLVQRVVEDFLAFGSPGAPPPGEQKPQQG